MKKLTLIVICTILTILFFEGTARILETVKIDIEKQKRTYFQYASDLCWESLPGYTGHPFFGKRHFDRGGFLTVDSAQIADTEKKKIVIIGDSNAFGFSEYNCWLPVELTFAEQLDKKLDDFDVINLGFPGYSSFQGYRILVKHWEKIKPDIIIASFNYNDRRTVFSSEDVDSPAKFKNAAKAGIQKQIFDKIYIYNLFRKIIERALPQRKSAIKVDINTLRSRVSPERYRENLTNIAKFAQKKDVKLFFLVLKDNPLKTKYCNKAFEYLHNNQLQKALELLEEEVKAGDSTSLIARRFLAETYKKKGELKKAEKVSCIPKPLFKLHGWKPYFLDTEYNEIMRTVAHEDNIELIEAGKLLDKNAEVYTDICHFNKQGHQIVADLIYTAIQCSKTGTENLY